MTIKLPIATIQIHRESNWL